MLASEFFFAPSLPFLPPSHRRRRRGRRDAFRTSLPRLSLGVVAKRFLSLSLSLSLSISFSFRFSLISTSHRTPSIHSIHRFIRTLRLLRRPEASVRASPYQRPPLRWPPLSASSFCRLVRGFYYPPPLCPAPMDPPWTPSRYTLGGADEWRETIRASFSFSLATSCLPSFDAGCAPVLFSPRLLFLLPTWLLVVTLII